MARNPHLIANPAQRALDQATAFGLVAQGHSFRSAADAMGRSKTYVHTLVKAECEERVIPARSEYIKLELARVDALWFDHANTLDRLKADLETLTALADRLKVIREQTLIRTEMRRLSERRMKMLGYDAPLELSATIHEGMDRVDVELHQIASEERAKMATVADGGQGPDEQETPS